MQFAPNRLPAPSKEDLEYAREQRLKDASDQQRINFKIPKSL